MLRIALIIIAILVVLKLIGLVGFLFKFAVIAGIIYLVVQAIGKSRKQT